MRWGRRCTFPCVHWCRCRTWCYVPRSRARASHFSARTRHGAPCTARAPSSRVGGKALAQGAQRTFYPTPPPSIVGRNRKIGGRRRARRGGLGGRCRAYTGGDAAGGATRRAAGSEHLIFPCSRVDGGVEERGWGEAGTTAQHTVRARGKGPPLWPRAAQQGPGMNMLATRTQRGARCTVHRAAK